MWSACCIRAPASCVRAPPSFIARAHLPLPSTPQIHVTPLLASPDLGPLAYYDDMFHSPKQISIPPAGSPTSSPGLSSSTYTSLDPYLGTGVHFILFGRALRAVCWSQVQLIDPCPIPAEVSAIQRHATGSRIGVSYATTVPDNLRDLSDDPQLARRRQMHPHAAARRLFVHDRPPSPTLIPQPTSGTTRESRAASTEPIAYAPAPTPPPARAPDAAR